MLTFPDIHFRTGIPIPETDPSGRKSCIQNPQLCVGLRELSRHSALEPEDPIPSF